MKKVSISLLAFIASLTLAGCGNDKIPNPAPLSGSFQGAAFAPVEAVAIPRGEGLIIRVSNAALSCQDYPGSLAPGRVTVDIFLPSANAGAYTLAPTQPAHEIVASRDPQLGVTRIEPNFAFSTRNVTEGTVFLLASNGGKITLSFTVSSYDVALNGTVTATRCNG